jgi:hypothetical protein
VAAVHSERLVKIFKRMLAARKENLFLLWKVLASFLLLQSAFISAIDVSQRDEALPPALPTMEITINRAIEIGKLYIFILCIFCASSIFSLLYSIYSKSEELNFSFETFSFLCNF